MKIYHYNDLNGLLGIVGSNSLWATHFSSLNDSNELIHGMNCLEKGTHATELLSERLRGMEKKRWLRMPELDQSA